MNTNTQDNDLALNKYGEVDISFYINQAHLLRAEMVHHLSANLRKAINAKLQRLASLFDKTKHA